MIDLDEILRKVDEYENHPDKNNERIPFFSYRQTADIAAELRAARRVVEAAGKVIGMASLVCDEEIELDDALAAYREATK